MTLSPAPVFRAYGITVVAGWVLLGAAGFWLASQKAIPTGLAAPLIAAFLVEYALYVYPGFRALRQAVVDRIPILVYASLLTTSAVVPYALASLACVALNGAGVDAEDLLGARDVVAVRVGEEDDGRQLEAVEDAQDARLRRVRQARVHDERALRAGYDDLLSATGLGDAIVVGGATVDAIPG